MRINDWEYASEKAIADLRARWTVDASGDGMWVVSDIVEAAMSYWQTFDEGSASDFIVYQVIDGAVIFGSWRRLRWSARTGFVPVESDANAREFNAHCRTIGPLPRRK